MKLAEYLTSHELTVSEFARRLGVPRQTVSNWALGNANIPRLGRLVKIMEITDGHVTPSDFILADERRDIPPWLRRRRNLPEVESTGE